ncbi:hypothetical protein BLOT_008046 [Blomia tropicalis]|nr:hypothetical protein BLOT_008046 [Blomia tropicalis]
MTVSLLVNSIGTFFKKSAINMDFYACPSIYHNKNPKCKDRLFALARIDLNGVVLSFLVTI